MLLSEHFKACPLERLRVLLQRRHMEFLTRFCGPKKMTAKCRKSSVHIDHDAGAAGAQQTVDLVRAFIGIAQTVAVAKRVDSENEIKGPGKRLGFAIRCSCQLATEGLVSCDVKDDLVANIRAEEAARVLPGCVDESGREIRAVPNLDRNVFSGTTQEQRHQVHSGTAAELQDAERSFGSAAAYGNGIVVNVPIDVLDEVIDPVSRRSR